MSFGISGTVTENGSPLSGITVVLLDSGIVPRALQRQVTDGSGNYAFNGLTNGAEYSVVAYDPSGGTNYKALIYDKVTPVSSTSTDSFWDNVVLLVGNDNRANGSTDITDSSLRKHEIYVHANAGYSSTQAPTGMTTSIAFDGSADKLQLTNNADFGIKNGFDVTIEWWHYQASAVQRNVLDTRETSSDNNFALLVNTTGKVVIQYNAATQLTSSNTATLSAWNHCAVTYNSSTVTFEIFVNGASGGTVSAAGLTAQANPSVSIGGGPGLANPSFSFNGYIAPFRWTKARRYTGAFTPPSLPLPTN